MASLSASGEGGPETSDTYLMPAPAIGVPSAPPLRPLSPSSTDALSGTLSSLGIDFKRIGRSEIEADIDRIGHKSYKINPAKGVWFSTDGQTGTLAGLLRRLGHDPSSLPLAPVSKKETEGRRQLEKIKQILRDSVPLDDAENNRTMIRSGRESVEMYLESRGLPPLLPPGARLRIQPNGYDLIVPLVTERDVPSIHITALDRYGQKRPLAWTEGSCRYTMGPLAEACASIPGAETRMTLPEFPNVPFYLIGEGLETVLSGRFLTGWPSIFAINANGVRSFFDNSETVKIFRESRAGLAILVDRDISEAGQEASASLARRAKEAGIPVLFFLPPAIVKGGKTGADWNDAITELGKEGAKGALSLAIARSKEELSKVETGKIVPLANVRDSKNASVEADRIPVDQAFGRSNSLIKDFLDARKPAPKLAAIDTGVGKSHALAYHAKDHMYLGDPVAIVAPTKVLAEEAADKSGGLFREGRTEDMSRAGHCPIYHEVVPYSDQRRSVVAHKCHDCQYGAAAMAVGRGEAPKTDPCPYILHTIDARQSPVLSTTGAMLEGDLHIGSVKVGNLVVKSKMILDDTAELSDHRAIHGVHVAEWIRAARHAMRFDRDKIDSGEIQGKGEDRMERIEATESLLPHLESLARFVADSPGDEQIPVDPENWTEFCKIVKSPNLKWMDGTTAEVVYLDPEGKTEIPLKTLKALGEALERGTAWIRKSVLHFSVSTQAFEAIKNGALVLDATPSLGIRKVVEALGGTSTEIRAKQDSLSVRLVTSGNHGKTACSIDSPSFEREKTHFLNAVESLQGEVGTENLAVLSHKNFIEAVGEEFGEIDEGHWGMDERGHNRWETKTALLIWGVQQLSPSVVERCYMSDRQAVIEAGGPTWPVWDGSRTERWYQIPSQKKEIFAAGYENEFIDFWHREWVTAKLVQAIGRLRATRRPGEELQVIIHSSFPFTESFGLEFTSVERPDWRTMNDYQISRKTEQVEKGIIAFHAVGGGGRRTVNDWLKAHGMHGIKPEDWAQIKGIASGSLHEYTLFPSGTTPDIFGEDAHLLVEALDRLAAHAAEGMTLEDLAGGRLVDLDPIERIAIDVIRASVRGRKTESPPTRFG